MDEQVKTVRIVIDASKAKDGAADVERALKSIDDKIEALGDTVARGAGNIAKFFAGFLTIDTLQTQIRGLTEAFDRLGTKARVFGTTTEWLQGFDFALASNTVKLDEGYKALERFTRLVGEGAQGNKAAVEVLDRLGLKIFDVNRQVRPVNDLFEEAARKIGTMRAGAEQNTLAIQSMGKTATAVIPALQDVGRGAEAMQAAGQKAGAIVSRESVKIWEDLAAAADKSMIRWRSFAGENFAESVKKGFEIIAAAISGALKLLVSFRDTMRELSAMQGSALQAGNEANAAGLRRNVLDPVNRELQEANDSWRGARRLRDQAQSDFDRNPTGAARRRLDETTAADAEAQRRHYDLLVRQGVAAWKVTNAAVGYTDTGGLPPVSRADFGLPPLPDPDRPPPTTGAYGATAADPGGADRMNKRIQLLEAEAAAQKKMAEAAKQGAAAVNEEEAGFKALQQALEVYGAQADRNDPKVKALADRFKELNQSIAESKAIIAFRLQTEDMDRQNAILQKRLDLFDAAPEAIAREIGQIEARNAAAKAGVAISEEDIAARGAAAEKQDLLNQKLQQSQRLSELWLQPIKSALSSMQQGLAGFFEQLFTGGINSWQAFVDSMKRIFIRMLAELAAVAVIRPVIAPVIAAGQNLGLIGAGTANQLGYPSIGGSSGGGGIGLPSLGGGSLFGGGSSGLFGFMGKPVMGAEAYNTAQMTASLTGASMPWYSGITWGQGLGAAAGIGMGAYQLLSGGGSTASTIGGIGSMIGGAVSLIPGVGQIAGPLISLASALIPGLFGGGPPEPPTQRATGALNFTGGRFVASGSEYGGAASVLGTLGGVGTTMRALLDAAGVSSLASGNSLGYQTFTRGEFSNATTFVNGRQWGQGSGSDAGLDTAAAHVAHKIMMELDSGISDVMREGLSNFGAANRDRAFSTKDLGDAVGKLTALGDAMKAFGKTTTDAESAIKAIDRSFDQLYNTAAEFKLSASEVAKIDRERDRLRLKATEDFTTGITQGILQIENPLQAALNDLERQRVKDRENNAAYARLVPGYADQAYNIERLYYLKRNELIEQQNAEALAAQQAAADAAKAKFQELQSVIDRLTFGDLSNLTGSGRYGGALGSFRATAAQALAGDLDAAARFGSEALSLADLGQQQFASGPGYEALRQEIVGLATQLQARTAGGVVPGAAANDGPVNIEVQQQAVQIQQLTALVAEMGRQQQDKNRRIDELLDAMNRLAVNK